MLGSVSCRSVAAEESNVRVSESSTGCSLIVHPVVKDFQGVDVSHKAL